MMSTWSLRRCSLLVALTSLASLVACDKKEEPRPDPAATKAAPTTTTKAPLPAPGPDQPVGVLAPTDQLRSIAAPPDGDVATQVKDTMAREAKDGRKVLVYIGATWCEPCKRFHASAARGELDKEFPNLTLLEYDTDRDGERLVTANYNTRLIPYFGVPGPDGRGTGKHIEGGVKGSVAVEDIAPRLHDLLAGK
jgi:thiol-disulfide isomerase/thioredoxin